MDRERTPMYRARHRSSPYVARSVDNSAIRGALGTWSPHARSTLPSPYTQAALSPRLPAATSEPPVQPTNIPSGAAIPMGQALPPRCTLKRVGASHSCISTITEAPSEDPAGDLAAYFPPPQRMPCPRHRPQPQQARSPPAQRTFRIP